MLEVLKTKCLGTWLDYWGGNVMGMLILDFYRSWKLLLVAQSCLTLCDLGTVAHQAPLIHGIL